MDLQSAATISCTTPFDEFITATSTWEDNGLVGDIVTTDRFLTIYNRPVHLRQLTYQVTTTLPASRTVRNQATGEVYILGQERNDTKGGVAYAGTVLIHLMSGQAGGLTDIHRKGATGPSNDPGHLVDSIISSAFFDMELKSSSEVAKQTSSTRAEYLIWTTSEVELEPWDIVALRGKNLRIHQTYRDSGYQMARAFDESDDRENLVYNRKTAAYDPDSGTPGAFTNYNVTGIFLDTEAQSESELKTAPRAVDLRILKDHIGFEPSTKDKFTSSSGVTFKVVRVATSGSRREWEIRGVS